MSVFRDRRVWIAAAAAAMLVLVAAVAFASSTSETSPTLPKVITPRPLRTTEAVVPTLPPAASATTGAVPPRSGSTTPAAAPVPPKATPPQAAPVEKPTVKPQPKAAPKAAPAPPAREVVTPYVREEDEQSLRPSTGPVIGALSTGGAGTSGRDEGESARHEGDGGSRTESTSRGDSGSRDSGER